MQLCPTRREYARRARWIHGGGWDASLWPDGVRAHRTLLDAAASDIPVALDSKDLHSIWLNSTALRHAGITEDSSDVAGGVIERDADGQPTGVLRENAMSLLDDRIPEPGLSEIVAAMARLFPAMWQTGIVAVHNASVPGDSRTLPRLPDVARDGPTRCPRPRGHPRG